MQEIKTTQLVKQYKNLTAVDKLGLEIQQGELFSLLGVNGAGKTTAIKMLSCLTKPTSGDAIVGGYSVTKESEQVKRLIGVSPQETAVAPNLSVKENLELICGIHSFSKEKTEAKIRELSGQFALDTGALMINQQTVVWTNICRRYLAEARQWFFPHFQDVLQARWPPMQQRRRKCLQAHPRSCQ